MGNLSFGEKRFWFTPAPDDAIREDLLAREAKFKWDGHTLRWVTRSPAKAVTLRRFADSSAEQILKKYFISEFEAPEQILYPDHLEPKIFQIESAWHALTRSPAYIADEQGLGKTVTSILCMNTVPGKTLIICPPFLKYNWGDEISKWLIRGGSFFLVESGDVVREQFTNADIIILPDSLLTVPCVQHYLKDLNFEWLIVDEAQRYKNAEAQRTIALVGSDEQDGKYFYYTKVARRTVFLSGTPIPNGKPIELYPLLSRIGFESIGQRDKTVFGILFCAGRQLTRMEGKRAIANWDFEGASNLKQLRRELKSKLMIRHLKRDVLSELPPKTRKLVFLDKPKQLEKFEAKVLKHVTLDELMNDRWKGGSKLGAVSQYQKEIGILKIPQATEYITDLLENSDDKLVVFAHHIEVVESLHENLLPYGALKIRGGMSAGLKAEQVKFFQTRSCHRVIVGNMDSMGVGNTLTKAPGLIMVEFSWVPGVNEQAEDRVHRMTQEKNVYIRYLTLRDSLDERKLRSVLSKERNIRKVMG